MASTNTCNRIGSAGATGYRATLLADANILKAAWAALFMTGKYGSNACRKSNKASKVGMTSRITENSSYPWCSKERIIASALLLSLS